MRTPNFGGWPLPLTASKVCHVNGHHPSLARTRPSPREVVQRRLTPRQREVLRRLLDGQPTTRIADELFISLHTVREHIQNLYERFGVTSRHELAAQFLDQTVDDLLPAAGEKGLDIAACRRG